MYTNANATKPQMKKKGPNDGLYHCLGHMYVSFFLMFSLILLTFICFSGTQQCQQQQQWQQQQGQQPQHNHHLNMSHHQWNGSTISGSNPYSWWQLWMATTNTICTNWLQCAWKGPKWQFTVVWALGICFFFLTTKCQSMSVLHRTNSIYLSQKNICFK